MIGLYLVIETYEMALVTRAVSGFASAPMSSLGILYMLQAFPKSKMGKGLCLALGIGQVASPIAFIISPSLLRDGGWHILYRFEFGLALCCLACIFSLKLPPSIRIKVIERMDFVTFALLAPAFALIGGVLAQGRTQWWVEQEWMGYALMAAFERISAVIRLLAAFRSPRPTGSIVIPSNSFTKASSRSASDGRTSSCGGRPELAT